MLLFFAVSGIWQTLGLGGSGVLRSLSTIHTSHGFKSGGTVLTSPAMVGLVLVMAASFIVTNILGIIMAVRFGRSWRTACLCLGAGVAIPMMLVLLRGIL